MKDPAILAIMISIFGAMVKILKKPITILLSIFVVFGAVIFPTLLAISSIIIITEPIGIAWTVVSLLLFLLVFLSTVYFASRILIKERLLGLSLSNWVINFSLHIPNENTKALEIVNLFHLMGTP